MKEGISRIFKIVRPSQHCDGKEEHIVQYERNKNPRVKSVGLVRWKCDCGVIGEWEEA